jgi:hypothetical protein
MGVTTDPPGGLRRRLIVLVLFGTIFGYVEAAAVVYIRAVYEPIHRRLFPDRAPDDLFPAFTQDQWSREGPASLRSPVLEVGRELGTVLLVALLAWGTSRGAAQGFASFMLAFGVWDLAYYVWLYALTGWPHSLWDQDLVFAAPLPWVGPVLAPVLVAAVMVVTAGIFFRREAAGRPVRPRRGHWVAVLAGGLAVMVAFWWDFRNILAGGVPGPFNWPLLAAGLAVGLAGFGHAVAVSEAAPASRASP